MTLPVLETSRSDSKPVELYRFTIEAQDVPGAEGGTTFWQDAMSYIDEAAAAAAGWTTVSQPTNPITWSAGGVTWHRTAPSGSTASSYVEKTVAVPVGALVQCEFTWEATGHWFEPLGVHITSGGDRASRGANPSGGDTRTTSFITAESPEVTIRITIHGGFGNGISHNDIYNVSFVRLIIITEDVPGIELPSEELHYARGERDFTFQGDIYLKSAFNRTPIRSGDGESQERIELRMPRDHPVARLFHLGPSTLPVKVTVFHVHRQDMVAGDSFTTVFVGQVGQSYFADGECVLTLESLRALLGYRTPAMLVQTKCANFLYDRQCGLNRESFKFTGTVAAVSGFSLTITGLQAAAGADLTKFMFGFIVAPSGEHLFIETQYGLDDTLTVLNPPQYTVVDDVVAVYWGCDKTAWTCQEKFNNQTRHNGRALMPRRNHWLGAGMVE